MLQTILRIAHGARRFNVPHTTILWLKYHIQGIGTTKVQCLSLPNLPPYPPYSPSNTPSSFGEGPHWLPDKVTWPIFRNHGAVMPGNPGGFGWHPTDKNYSSEPIQAMEMQCSAWGTWFVLFRKWRFTTDCWFNPWQTNMTNNFFGQFSQLWNPPLKLMCVFFFSVYGFINKCTLSQVKCRNINCTSTYGENLCHGTIHNH